MNLILNLIFVYFKLDFCRLHRQLKSSLKKTENQVCELETSKIKYRKMGCMISLDHRKHFVKLVLAPNFSALFAASPASTERISTCLCVLMNSKRRPIWHFWCSSLYISCHPLTMYRAAKCLAIFSQKGQISGISSPT